MASLPIKVLIVENSPSSAQLLADIIRLDAELTVMGVVEDAKSAFLFLQTKKPDVILVSILLPQMDGFEATHYIMQYNPTPIIILSTSYQNEDVIKSFQAMNAGALDILEKPKEGAKDANFLKTSKALIQSIKTVVEIKNFKRNTSSVSFSLPPLIIPEKPFVERRKVEAIAIGASIGGPQALSAIFTQLPRNFSFPIFIVQHIAPGFIPGFITWLEKTMDLNIELARNLETAKPGYIYVAPDYHHLEVAKGGILKVIPDAYEKNCRSSIGCLFYSMAKAYGSHGVGIILTGMGNEGAKELLLMKEAGALTIAQNQDSCLVFSMPKAAIAIGAVDKILSLEDIALTLNKLT